MASKRLSTVLLALTVAAIGAGCEQGPPALRAILDHLRRGHPVTADAGAKPDAKPPADAGTSDAAGSDLAGPDIALPTFDAAEFDVAPLAPDAAPPDLTEPGPTCSGACMPGARRCGPEGVIMQECTQRDDACPDWVDDPRCVPCEPGSLVVCPGSGAGGFI